MKKTIFIIITIIILLFIGFLIYKNSNKYNGIYEIYVKKIDNMSPDVHLIVKRNDKETKKYKYIIYKKDNIEKILCYVENPTTNQFNLDVDSLIVVLPNDEQKEVKIIKE